MQGDEKMNSLKLKSKRVGKGFNQEKTALAINTTLPTYCNKENGKNPFTTVEIEKLAELFDLSVNDVDEIFFNGNLSKRLNNEQAAI
jgi:DNA-binding XRE family transcriptional regulator